MKKKYVGPKVSNFKLTLSIKKSTGLPKVPKSEPFFERISALASKMSQINKQRNIAMINNH